MKKHHFNVIINAMPGDSTDELSDIIHDAIRDTSEGAIQNIEVDHVETFESDLENSGGAR